jgi:hypothetical protein
MADRKAIQLLTATAVCLVALAMTPLAGIPSCDAQTMAPEMTAANYRRSDVERRQSWSRDATKLFAERWPVTVIDDSGKSLKRCLDTMLIKAGPAQTDLAPVLAPIGLEVLTALCFDLEHVRRQQ